MFVVVREIFLYSDSKTRQNENRISCDVEIWIVNIMNMRVFDSFSYCESDEISENTFDKSVFEIKSFNYE